MRPEQVPQEWVEAVAHAWPESMLVRRHLVSALAAVAPMIAAAERERITDILRAHESGYAKSRASYQAAQNGEMTAFVGGKESALGVALHAIRALDAPAFVVATVEPDGSIRMRHEGDV